MSTVEDIGKVKILDDSNCNMPAIQQNNKKFFGTSSKSSTVYRGIFQLNLQDLQQRIRMKYPIRIG